MVIDQESNHIFLSQRLRIPFQTAWKNRWGTLRPHPVWVSKVGINTGETIKVWFNKLYTYRLSLTCSCLWLTSKWSSQQNQTFEDFTVSASWHLVAWAHFFFSGQEEQGWRFYLVFSQLYYYTLAQNATFSSSSCTHLLKLTAVQNEPGYYRYGLRYYRSTPIFLRNTTCWNGSRAFFHIYVLNKFTLKEQKFRKIKRSLHKNHAFPCSSRLPSASPDEAAK